MNHWALQRFDADILIPHLAPVILQVDVALWCGAVTRCVFPLTSFLQFSPLGRIQFILNYFGIIYPMFNMISIHHDASAVPLTWRIDRLVGPGCMHVVV